MNTNFRLKKMVLTALFAALTCAATMSIRIPAPGTGGYIHPGDAAVILSGMLLGPAWGSAAAGLGSAMADLLGGYFIYVPITLVIKSMIAFSSGILFQKWGGTSRGRCISLLFSGILDIFFVAGGYFLCEIPLYGISSAAASIPANLIQGVSGLLIAFVLFPILLAIPEFREILLRTNC